MSSPVPNILADIFGDDTGFDFFQDASKVALSTPAPMAGADPSSLFNDWLESDPMQPRAEAASPSVSDVGSLVESHVSAEKEPASRSSRKRASATPARARINKDGQSAAQLAKLNRERQKKKQADLESRVERLAQRNEELEQQMTQKMQQMEAIQREVQYLRGTLANAPQLASVLTSLAASPIPLRFVTNTPEGAAAFPQHSAAAAAATTTTTTAGGTRKRKRTDEDETVDQMQNKQTSMTGGICLHLSGNTIGLAFCEHCSHVGTMQAGGGERRNSKRSRTLASEVTEEEELRTPFTRPAL